MIAATEREREILRAIRDMSVAKGYPPSVRELCEELNIASTNGVIEHLKRLHQKGLLVREIATARAVRLTLDGAAEARDVDRRETPKGNS